MENEKLILGAVIGDTIGSVYEWSPVKDKALITLMNSCHFTDDTVMTVANMMWLCGEDRSKDKLIECMHYLGQMFPKAGYGGTFYKWITEGKTEPYNSWGNGSAMRVSPVAWAFDTLDEVLEYAKISAEVTHNHEEGIKGAQAIAAATFLARTGKSKAEIKEYVEKTFGYDLDRKLEDIRPDYKFDVSCQGSVPESLISFLESDSYADAIENAISLGGDTDTMADMAGAIAEAYYGGVPEKLQTFVWKRLPVVMMEIITEFSEKYGSKS